MGHVYNVTIATCQLDLDTCGDELVGFEFMTRPALQGSLRK